MERKNNTAAIFKNKYKEKDSQPTYKGEGVVNGQEVKIAIWINTSKSGESYMSATFENKEEQDYGSGDKAPEQKKEASDDFIPF